MAISTKGTVLTVKKSDNKEIEVKIKSFPDLGVAPAAIDVTSLADDVQKFIPGVKGMGAMEFVANYDEAQFAELTACENEELTYVIKINGVNWSAQRADRSRRSKRSCRHEDRCYTVFQDRKDCIIQAKVMPDISGEKGLAPFFPL